MSDYEFSDTSDNEYSDAEAELEELASDFEDDEAPLPDLHSACHQANYASASGLWSAAAPPVVETFPPYYPLPEELKDPDSEADLFGYFISLGIIKTIVKHTNEELDGLRKKIEKKSLAKSPPLQPTNDDEIKAKCGRHFCLKDLEQLVHCMDCRSTSPARKVTTPSVTQHLTRSQAKSVEPKVVGRCALCPTNQKVKTLHRCEACGKLVCTTHLSKRNNLFCQQCLP